MAMDAETIGGSVVHAAGSAIIWGSCRGSQAASETAGKACMVYFHLSLRELSTLFPVSAPLQQQLASQLLCMTTVMGQDIGFQGHISCELELAMRSPSSNGMHACSSKQRGVAPVCQ